MNINHYLIISIILLIVSVTQSLTNAPDYYYRDHYGGRTIIVCHRGQSAYFPENSYESFFVGAQQNCDFMELDIHLTKDLQFYVIHDPGMNRTTNIEDSVLKNTTMSTLYVDDYKHYETDYFVLNYTSEELGKVRLRMSNWTTSSYGTYVPYRNHIFDEKFQIPSFDSILELCISYNNNNANPQYKPVGIYIEIKYPEFYDRFLRESTENITMVSLLHSTLKKFGLDNATYAGQNCPIILESFGKPQFWVNEFKNTDLPVTQLLESDWKIDYEYIASYAHGIGVWSKVLYNFNQNHELVVTDVMEKARQHNLTVHIYTVRDDYLDYPEFNSPIEEYFRLMMQVEVDGIFCDYGGQALMFSYAFQNFNNQNLTEDLIYASKQIDNRRVKNLQNENNKNVQKKTDL